MAGQEARRAAIDKATRIVRGGNLHAGAATRARPQRTLFAGSRGWPWALRNIIEARVALLPAGSLVIHGGAHGVDELAAGIAEARRDLYVIAVRPRWRWIGNGAGHARNSVVVGLLDPDLDHAEVFWDGESPGTAGVIDLARRRGIPVRVAYLDGRVEMHGGQTTLGGVA